MMALALIGLSFFTSLITATFSLGGGILMLATMALVFPPAVVIPLHGAVQFGSNSGRAVIQRKYIRWDLIVWVSLGVLVGAMVGGQFSRFVPAEALTVVIALFVLVTAWLPQPKIIGRSPAVQFAGGAVISALSMVVGATGPLIALFLKGLPDRLQLVATHAMLMTIQNGIKIAVFIALGFGFAPYLPLLVAMVVAGVGGTAVGSRLLVHVPEKAFRWGFKILLTLIALDLLRNALFTAPVA